MSRASAISAGIIDVIGRPGEPPQKYAAARAKLEKAKRKEDILVKCPGGCGGQARQELQVTVAQRDGEEPRYFKKTTCIGKCKRPDGRPYPVTHEVPAPRPAHVPIFETPTPKPDVDLRWLARRLKEARESAGLDAGQLADQIHQPVSTIEGWEHWGNNRAPSRANLTAIAWACGKDLTYFRDTRPVITVEYGPGIDPTAEVEKILAEPEPTKPDKKPKESPKMETLTKPAAPKFTGDAARERVRKAMGATGYSQNALTKELGFRVNEWLRGAALPTKDVESLATWVELAEAGEIATLPPFNRDRKQRPPLKDDQLEILAARILNVLKSEGPATRTRVMNGSRGTADHVDAASELLESRGLIERYEGLNKSKRPVQMFKLADQKRAPKPSAVPAAPEVAQVALPSPPAPRPEPFQAMPVLPPAPHQPAANPWRAILEPIVMKGALESLSKVGIQLPAGFRLRVDLEAIDEAAS